MTQPKWKLVAQQGDANPVEYGGQWIFEDRTGVYDPEIEVWIPGIGEEGGGIAFRWSLVRCSYVKGVLSANKFHPDHPEWFADSIKSVAASIGEEPDQLIQDLCGEDLNNRASAYIAIADYHGYDNFDSYPLEMTEKEAKRRYKAKRYQMK